MAGLSIRLLGGFQVDNEGEPILGFKSDRVRALLAFLAVENDRPHPRDYLAWLLWPDSPNKVACTNLRSILANLRKVINDPHVSPAFLLINRQTIQMNKVSDHWLDVSAFESSAAETRIDAAHLDHLEEAIGLYKGPFLNGFSIGNSAPFEEWALLKREQLRLDMLEMLMRLASHCEQNGDFDRATTFARRIVELEPWEEEGHRQLMRLLAYSGRRSSALVQFATCQRSLETDLGVQPAQETISLYEDICAGRYESKVLPPVEEPPYPGSPPYKGLQHFGESDEGLFFGRERLTARLVGYLEEMANQKSEMGSEVGSCILTVVGASGIGKSSLVRGGLIPAIHRSGMLADQSSSAGWQVHLITPTAHPLEALAFRLVTGKQARSEADRLVEEMKGDGGWLGSYLRQRRKKLLLVVDQFEELFTLCRDEAERAAFIANLLAAANDGSVMVVIALRADFYTHCSRYPQLREAICLRQEFIGAMEQEELRRTIEAPAEVGGWVIEPGLVDLILRDVGDEPGALPLLSHALLETWKRREGRLLTLKGYAATSGVRGAIATTADRVYKELSPKQKLIARRVFLRLTELGEGTLDTRRRATPAEMASSPPEIPEVENVLQMLADARLVILTADSAEVAHEALIREWPALRDWLDEDREGLRLQRHLTEAAMAWDEIERDPGELYRGARLARALEWAARAGNYDELNDLERSFLAASQEKAQTEAAKQQAMQRREIEAAQALAQAEQQRAQEQARAAGRLKRLATYLAAALALVVILLGVAYLFAKRNASLAEQSAASASYAQTQRAEAQFASTQAVAASMARATQQYLAEMEADTRATAEANASAQRDLADQQAHLAHARELALAANQNLNTDPELSMLLALQAVSEIRGVGRDVPAEVQQALHLAVLSSRARLTITAHIGEIYGLAFSPDGRLLATAGEDQIVKIWNSKSGILQNELSGHTATVVDVTFNPDGTRIATSSEDLSVKIWETSSGKLLRTLDDLAAFSETIDFSPDGKLLATTGEAGSVILWAADTGEKLRSFTGHTGAVHDVAFSPDRVKLASASEDGTVVIWDIQSGRQLLKLDLGQPTYSIAYSPDGALLVTGEHSGTAHVWDATIGQELLTLAGHNLMLRQAIFSPDGSYLATASQDGETKIWDASSGVELYTLSTNAGAVYDAAFSKACVDPPDGPVADCGPRLATAYRDGTVKIWNVTPGGNSETLVLPGFDGQYLEPGRLYTNLISDSEMIGQTWDITSRATGEPLSQTSFSGFPAPVVTGCVSPDMTRMATISQDGAAQLWDTSSGVRLNSFALTSHRAAINAADLSPDHLRLATASDDGTARVWDITSGEELLNLSGHLEFVWDVAFSPDGNQLATAGSDHTGRIWDAHTGELLLILAGHNLPVNVVAFSADGQKLVSAGMDGTARIWDSFSGKSLMTLDGHTATVVGAAFSPDGSRLVTGSYDGTVKVWDVSSGAGSGTLLFSLPVTGWPINIHFNPEGTHMAVGFFPDQLVREYILDINELVQQARSRVTRNLTQPECQQYLHVEACP